MNEWKNYRNYEVSVWTLQDNYITTLKSGDPILVTSSSAAIWPQARAQGQIQNGQMELNIDGTQTLSFDIPMYLYINGQRIENPNWYDIHTEDVNKALNTKNKETITGNILTSMRKVKIIFDKWENIGNKEAISASTFEFIILRVQETHEQDNLICHVECEGLAFHELGKIGYKRALSAEGFNNQYYNWSIKTVGTNTSTETFDYATEQEKSLDKPFNNLQYWMEDYENGARIRHVPKKNGAIDYDSMNPTEWYYDIRMAHTALVHDDVVYDDKIYEEGFPVDWNTNGTPTHYMEVREKARLVDLKESNLYNITQDLAEKFEVFCRYEYIYDNNYNICGRLIIFYNNFLQEGKDVETLMYPNSASKISRAMDSTDVSTKMFVRSVENDDLYTGSVNIIDCSANKTREDYLMNFDYLYDIGTINQEQYDSISQFESVVRILNDKITPLQEAWSNLANVQVETNAKITNLSKSIELDEERITENMAIINALDAMDGDQDGFITRDYRNPEIFSLLKDSSEGQYDTYYIQLNSNDKCQGIQPETLKLYKTCNSTASKTYKYSIGFRPWDSSTVKAQTDTAISLPSKNSLNKWIDKEPVYKGTIGSSNADITAFPEKPEIGWIYRTLTENYPQGYSINVNGLFIYTGTEWEMLQAPAGLVYDEVADNSKIKNTDLASLYIKNSNGTYSLTSDTTVNANTTYYVAYEYNEKKGFYIFTVETLRQLNGPVTQLGSCKRQNASDTSTSYITYIRHLYYVTSTANDTPSKPTIATATTDATEIVNVNTLETWSSFLSTPDEINDETADNLSQYKYSHVWEFIYSSSYKEYTNVATTTGDKIKDTTNTTVKSAVINAPSNVLMDELHGSFQYDGYMNLDKVTGLFKSPKQGSYFTYGVIASGFDINNANSYDAISNTNNGLIKQCNNLASSHTFPTDKKNKYVIVKEQQHCSNGNIIYSYTLKYYNNDELYVTPTNPSTKVKSIFPIFYLSTGNAPAASNPTSVKTSKVNDQWTTVLPDKTEDSWKYYRGWAVSTYDGETHYYVLSNNSLVQDDTLKMKITTDSTENNDTIPKYVYATFKYKPDWYYEQIKNCWEQKLYADNQELQTQEARKTTLDNTINNLKKEIDKQVAEKEQEIAEFEHMMGAALRESYWQPENEYQDYGARYEEQLDLFFSELYNTLESASFLNNTTDEHFASIGWDSILFNEEDKLYYESSVLKKRIYYPCIDLLKLVKNSNKATITSFLSKYITWAKGGTKSNPYSFFFNPTNKTIPLDASTQDVRYCQYYTIGSNAKLAFIRSGTTVRPVLILLDASALSDAQLQHLYSSGAIGQLTPEQHNNNVILTMDKAQTYPIAENNAWLNVQLSNNEWIENPSIASYEIVYPRIIIPSLKLKNNSKDLVVNIGKSLESYENYYVLTKSYYHNTDVDTTVTINSTKYNKVQYKDIEKITNQELTNYAQLANYYTITIKPEYLFDNIDLSNCNGTNFNIPISIYFIISNADIDIYLDAKKILKENAYPKVSYEIEVSKWSPTLLANLHTKLAQLVMVNDTDLKLKNTFGYISSVKLDLDHEEKDSIEVKNYKTKFEDLFSKIVAETEEMHKNSRNIGLAGVLASGDSVNATLDPEGFSSTLQNTSNQQILQQFLSEYFDGPEVVQQTLQDMWDEAGAILSSAAQSLNNVMSTTTRNASILAGFRENVAAALSPKIFTGTVQPTTFKPGDIWINEEDGTRMVATGYSGRGGFTKTHDGKLAEISGANMTFDAEAGTVDIYGQAQIDIRSGKNVYIAAGSNIDIVGNKAVNIGGTTINMASCNIIGNGYPGEVGSGGIHLVTTDYNYNYLNDSLKEGATSRVDVMGEGIELASKNGIIIKSGAGIDIKSSDDENVSAVQIDKDKGVWIGSNKTVSLFAGTDGVGGKSASGASVELSAEHLLLGVADTVAENGAATAIELSTKQIILAAGDNLNDIKADEDGLITDFGKSAIAGLQIQKDYIGLAVGNTENNRSLLSLKPKKVLFGTIHRDTVHYTFMNAWNPSNANTTKKYLVPEDEDKDYYKRYEYKNNTWKITESHIGPEAYTGSYLWLAENEIYMGSMGSLTINTANMKLQSKLLENGTADKNGSFKDTTVISQMGFVLGRYLQGKDANGTDVVPEPAFGFWIDSNGGKHLVIDADLVRLGHDGVVDSVAFNETVPVAIIKLYTVHTSNTTKPVVPTGHAGWGKLSSVNLASTEAWSENIPTANGSETAKQYIWSTTQSEYSIGSTSEYRATTPVCEGSLNDLTSITQKEFKRAASEPAADSSGWTLSIPTASTTTKYYYDDSTLCTYKSAITSNTTLSDGSDNDLYLINANNITITVGSIQTICKKGDYFIRLSGAWTKTDKIVKKSKKNLLYSRIHTIKNTGEHIYSNVELEEELSDISEAAAQAWNIANGTYPVPSVSSSGLSIDGDNVVLGSTGKLYMLGNSEIMVGTSSSNSALLMNKNGISIGTEGNIGIVSSGDKGIDIKVINNNTEYNGITMNKNTGFKVYSNVAINMDAPNFKVVSSPTAGNPYFYVGDSGDSPDTYIKYVSSITANDATTPAHLEVKGTITATAFSLTESAEDDFKTAVNGAIDGDSFTTAGVGWVEWPEESGNYYVSLTSTAKKKDVKGILIGVSQSQDVIQHLIVPYSASKSETAVDISKKGIKFSTYSESNDTLTETSHIFMDKDGIDVKGKRIKINNKEVWARDDIIILKRDDKENDIIEDMDGKSDWVMIKPFYNAKVTAKYSSTFQTLGSGQNFNDNLGSGTQLEFDGDETTLGDYASWYVYKVTCILAPPSGTTSDTTSGTARISNTTGRYVEVAISGGSINEAVTWTGEIKRESSDILNLCKEGEKLYIQIRTGSSSQMNCSSVTVECTNDATTSRVPCSVYYFP